MNLSTKYRHPRIWSLWLAAATGLATAPRLPAGEPTLHQFDRQVLTDVYYSEGVNAGDLNGDGHPDIVHGPYWFAGPDFKQQHEIYAATPQNRDRYANSFFSWVYDFDQDGANDVFAVGFPGTPAYVYRNPGQDQLEGHWEKHQVFDSVSNESPHFVDLVGDERPELVCTRDGLFGYATMDADKPLAAWTFHVISSEPAPKPFGHGLGVGDVNSDGRRDVITKDGWFEQPQSPDQVNRWMFHPVRFAAAGGAEMYAYDVDGDGDCDIITSLEAHSFGLAWFEQIKSDAGVEFRRHLIMGKSPAENRYGLVFTEPHSVNLADIDGDGLLDIVTGKTYWSHHRQSPLWDAGAVVYWFRLVRGENGVDWVPYQAAADAGIGRQVIIQDVNGDALPDILVGGMKGCSVLLQRRETVSREQWDAAQPKLYDGPTTVPERGPKSPLDQSGKVPGALEGETLKVLRATAGQTRVQDMEGFREDRWSGNSQLFWTGAKPGEQLELELSVAADGTYDVEAVLTMARDYAIVRLNLDGEPLGAPLDLFNHPDVVTTGVIQLGRHHLVAGPHKLSIEIVGSNPAAAKAYLAGLDYLRLMPVTAAKQQD